MSSSKASYTRAENRVLAALPREQYEQLLPHLELVRLAPSKVLYEAGDTARHAFFPQGGVVSLLSLTQDGETIEVAMVGNEGFVGVPVLLRVGIMPYRAMVQIPAEALRIEAERLRDAFNRAGLFQDLALRYMHALITQLSQSAVCNHFHSVEQRLCRWLLVTRDRLHTDTFDLTQEFLSQMLGVPRTSISTIAGRLQKARLIRYSRGKIQLLDQQGMQAASCECYGVVTDALSRILIP